MTGLTNFVSEESHNHTGSMKGIQQFLNRVEDLEILSRIIKGVNYTQDINDIFELVYSQINQAVPSYLFSIILMDPIAQNLNTVFWSLNDERYEEKENKLIQSEQVIEIEVIQSQLGICIEDYLRYCQKSNLPIFYENIQSLMCIPLNTGADCIGCLVIGRRDSENAFEENDFVLVQSIADIVAGSIEKANLITTTDDNTRRLRLLNQLTQKLASTILVGELHQTILKSMLELVPSQDARLLIVDDKGTDLIYQTIFGRKSSHLFLSRTPVQQGYHGKVFSSQKALSVNRFENAMNEVSELNDFYGQDVHSLMVIPLLLKNQVLGMVEMINQKPTGFFNETDLDLCSALASQAAIALENARIYRHTGIELNSRMEELSVMQKIDQELNTDLDVKKSMEITLKWAIRHIRADAGWIALAENTGYAVQITSSGLDELDDDRSAMALKELLLMLPETNEPVIVNSDQVRKLNAKTNQQILVPIHRDRNTIALIVLELFEQRPIDRVNLNFLSRLADHASIAIVNSQLYLQVQQANLAKSEFVSHVAHELKNPMTSIKGYTELLANGFLGKITVEQENFLTIIRNNINRMSTIVSDLNDITKIETGKLRLDSCSLNITSILKELVNTTRTQLEKKKQQLVIDIENDLPEVYADPSRLVQILVNLISNANKYSPEHTNIAISAKASKNKPLSSELLISVKDEGIGISPEDQKFIFDKFYRSEDPQARLATGSGLGLNITRELIEMQGGRIWLESELSKGTTFNFTLPFAKSEK